ncbi:MAG: hypothetical protein WBS54_07300 [Acidobacteriota bacterium]
MRMMLKVSMPVAEGNKAIKDGSLPKTVMAFVEKYKPEACYFTSEGGLRTGIFFFDMAHPSDIPSIAEPFFMALNAGITFSPAMNLEDMKAGVQKAMEHA